MAATCSIEVTLLVTLFTPQWYSRARDRNQTRRDVCSTYEDGLDAFSCSF